MKRKVLVGFASMVLAILMIASTAFAAPVVEYDNAGTVDWGKNGGGIKDEIFIAVGDGVDLDRTLIDTITTIEVVIDSETYFKPQFAINTESNNWEQEQFEFAEGGHHVYTADVTGKYKAANSYNNFVIQSGWKNEGKVVVTSVAFKDADGNVVYSVGDLAVEEEVVEEETTVEEEVAEEVVEEVVEEAAEEVATEAPKTGVVSLALVYGLGALATGAVALKRRNK